MGKCRQGGRRRSNRLLLYGRGLQVGRRFNECNRYRVPWVVSRAGGGGGNEGWWERVRRVAFTVTGGRGVQSGNG